MIRSMVPLLAAAFILHAAPAGAQNPFPAPLPNQSGVVRNDPAFPPVNGAPSGGFPSGGVAPVTGAGGFGPPPGAASPPQAGAGDACMKAFIPLREDAEKKGKMIKAASDRHAGPDEACKLIANFGRAELKMISYVETNAAKCGIPPQIADQLKAGHKNTEAMQAKVCNVAQQMQNRAPAGPSLSEVLGSSTAAPEATATKKGGSTFDTLNGNVLAR
ncbi:MAG: hypothetical protein JOY90_32240 [Bradyrhizobium sp.]|uniref:hypothetical protein n=1 Tax=Bradyrhizobium sp. TaxID=376 RepID=UPI001DBC6D95|nr:hypothetical protein [Bradyrhizobium sp.]MBV9565084.1 hypothetical protein [Bradyrhizobium sp.]